MEWRSRGRIEEFPLGERDKPERLLIPEKLYGRASEIDALLASFDRVVEEANPNSFLFPATRVLANLPSSTNSINRSSRRAAFLHQASSTSTNETSRMRPSPKPSRASSVQSWQRTKPIWAVGAMPCARRSIRMVSSWWT